mgnify:CR=1 FL=1
MKKNILMLALLSVVGSVVSTDALAQNKVYRFVDDKGNVVYSDNIPANEKGKIEILASTTMALKDIQEKELTSEEAEAQRAIVEEQEVAKKTSELEKQRNQALLNQYNSVNDIEKLKEYELQQISRTLASNEEVLLSLEKNKDQILQETSNNKGKVPAKLERDLADIDNNIKNVEKAVEANRELYQSREQKYEDDKKQYIQILEQMGKSK